MPNTDEQRDCPVVEPGDVWVIVALVPFQLGCMVYRMYWKRSTDPAIGRGLQAWQDRTGDAIVERRKAWVGGPFALTSSRPRIVYRVTPTGPTGDRRRGDARVGSFWGGAFWRPDLVKVIPDGPDFRPIPDPGHD